MNQTLFPGSILFFAESDQPNVHSRTVCTLNFHGKWGGKKRILEQLVFFMVPHATIFLIAPAFFIAGKRERNGSKTSLQ